MSFTDKAKDKAQELAGQAKEKTGEATGDQQLQAEGQTDQTDQTSSRPARTSRTRSASKPRCAQVGAVDRTAIDQPALPVYPGVTLGAVSIPTRPDLGPTRSTVQVPRLRVQS